MQEWQNSRVKFGYSQRSWKVHASLNQPFARKRASRSVQHLSPSAFLFPSPTFAHQLSLSLSALIPALSLSLSFSLSLALFRASVPSLVS